MDITNALPRQKEPKNLGIELFRITAMILIVLLHVLGQGGVYAYTEYLGTNYKIAWFLETAAYCSVNCYALISGFVGVRSRFRFRKIVYLWLEVIFITLTTTALFSLRLPYAVTTDDWLKAAFPLIKREYWYFNAYVLMFPFLPFLNKGILSISRRQHLAAMLFLFVVTSLLPLFTERDIFELSNGYSTIWLMVLYLFGAYFKLYGIPKIAHPIVCLLLFLGATFAAWGQKISILFAIKNGTIQDESLLAQSAGDLIGYTSPCMVIMALSLLWLFVQIRVRGKIASVIISNLGKATFGVFLVHVGAVVWKFIDGRWEHYAEMTPFMMTLSVLVTTVFVYLVCSLYSLLRIYLFQLLRVHRAVDAIADRLSS